MIAAILRYLPSVVAVILADVLAYLLSPVAALPFFVKTDESGREHIRQFWRWITTHDTTVDTYAYGSAGRTHWLLKRFDVVNPANNPGWLRYMNRLLWIWRNPAYYVSHWLGYDQDGVERPAHGFKDEKWNSGESNRAFYKVKNAKGRTGFLYQQQWYFAKPWCLELQFGWKLYRQDSDNRCMLAFRITVKRKKMK